jgi:membrane associated rhomboid family serine protease
MITIKQFIKNEHFMLKELFEEVQLSQFKIYLITLALLLIGYFAPINTELLKLSKENFAWPQIFTSSFVHANLEHFLINLLLFTFTYFLIVLITNNRKDLWKQFTKYYMLIIIIVSIISYIGFIMNPLFKNSCGFSNIITALIGVMIFFTIEVLNKELNLKINYQKTKTTILFTLYLAATSTTVLLDYIMIMTGLTNTPTQYSWIIIALILNVITIFYIKDKIKISQIKKYLKQKPTRIITLFMILTLTFGLPALSQIAMQQGNMTNGLAHFIGLYVGFFIIYFIQANKKK